MNKIPLIRPSMPALSEYIDEISSIWDTRVLTNMAAKHQQLEKELASYLGVELFQLFVNGHQALEYALQGLELSGEVITTPYTFASTTQAIIRCGLKPVFCDIREDDYTIDASKIEVLITEKTSAILPVHVYGTACDVDEIARIAQKHNLNVIYDAAHAFGVSINGIGIGNFGDVSMYSFHATKTYHTIEGGGLAYRDQALGKKLFALKNFGIDGGDQFRYAGGNGKMDEFRAAMGLCNLRHVDDEMRKRKAVAERYDERLTGVKGIKLLPKQQGVTKNYSYYPIVLDGYKKSRDMLFDELRANGILSRKYFYPLCSEFDCYRERFEAPALPVAGHISQNVLCLPMFAGLTTEEADRVCDVVLQ